MTTTQRTDEVAKYYKPVDLTQRAGGWLFWLLVLLSLVQLFTPTFLSGAANELAIAFIVTTIIYFGISVVRQAILIPRAEGARRRQNLSDALGTSLSPDSTALYYNNNYRPSIQRLGANTFENSLFSKEIASEMLKTTRLIVVGYLMVWVAILAIRQTDLTLVVWVTQLVFSAEIIAGAISLEILRHRHQVTFDRCYDFFLHRIGEGTPEGVATVLDLFAGYEAAKASAGLKLDSKCFERLNPQISEEWEKIKVKLKMVEV